MAYYAPKLPLKRDPSTGYEMLGEALDEKDIVVIKKLIRNVVGDILRDIWLKRNSWK